MLGQTPELQAKIQEIRDSLPRVIAPLKETTAVLLPLGTYGLDIETHRGLLSSINLYAGEMAACGHSDVGMAREELFNGALRTPFEWFVCIDSDIGFGAEDLAELLYLDHPADYAVNGVYAKKQDTEEAVTMGLGFARIHRCVLEAIAKHYPLKYEKDGQEYQQFCLQSVTGNRKMMREDVGFWFLCSMVGVRPRLLNTIALRHYGGRRGYVLSEFARMHL